MIILPAIDIKDGICVRLVQGEYDTAYKVANDPLETALSFEEAGSEWIHMVDLDGAKDGKLVNNDIVVQVAKKTGLKVEIGGGIRNMQSVEEYLDNGVSRVILGSAAIKDIDFVTDALRKYREKIAIGIDARDGFVAAEGWLDTSSVNYIELAKQMVDLGAKTIIFTDISKDGTLAGPNLTQLDLINTSVDCDIIASGGVSSLKDILNLKDLGVAGAICGKAIYSGSLDLSVAINVSKIG